MNSSMPEGLRNILPITTAKVPIVKFYHVRTGLEGDISLYNTLVSAFSLEYYVCYLMRSHLSDLPVSALLSGPPQHTPAGLLCGHRPQSEDPVLRHEGVCQGEDPSSLSPAAPRGPLVFSVSFSSRCATSATRPGAASRPTPTPSSSSSSSSRGTPRSSPCFRRCARYAIFTTLKR